MTARTRVSTLALAVSIALGHASALQAASQPTKTDSYGMRAIIGGDVSADAIIGGDRQKAKRAIIGGDLDSMLARGTVAHGPIESLDPAKGLIVVLGQTFRFGGTAAQMKLIGDRISTGETILVSVTGAVDSKGSLRVKGMSLSARQYVPGATDVMVVGKVRTVDASLGIMTVGSLRVDYAAALASGAMQFSPGQMVAIFGVQSAPRMPLIASSIKTL